jgi:3-methyladenine DNA glycosylase Tag
MTRSNARITKTAKNDRQQRIKELNDYIWSLQHKCPTITKINANMIMQFCQFSVMASDLSTAIQSKDINRVNPVELKEMMDAYASINKVVLALYKALQFDKIKDEKADNGNKFQAMFLMAQKEGDF